jgi:hypothetical protein
MKKQGESGELDDTVSGRTEVAGSIRGDYAGEKLIYIGPSKRKCKVQRARVNKLGFRDFETEGRMKMEEKKIHISRHNEQKRRMCMAKFNEKIFLSIKADKKESESTEKNSINILACCEVYAMKYE